MLHLQDPEKVKIKERALAKAQREQEKKLAKLMGKSLRKPKP
jgi:hypothetical protein